MASSTTNSSWTPEWGPSPSVSGASTSVEITGEPTPFSRLEPQAAVVEQAVGVLMFRYGLGSYEALGVLARWSHDACVDVPELSRILMHGICLGRIDTEDRRATLVRWLVQRMRTDPALDPSTT